MLIDNVVITIRAGKGGNGKVSLKRNAQTAKGGPDGGNGGNGGSIFFQGSDDITALREFQYKKEVKAEEGVPGGKNNLYGRNAVDSIIFVPMGTRILDLETKQIFEIVDKKTRVLLAQGGIGGRGNNEFKTATHQTPREAETGTPGEIKQLQLTLRLIADIGFIGLPNAGKSSLLSVLTKARPKIGDYPFTTLEPNLGVMSARQNESQATAGGDRLVLADIPGLIEGASHGKGLGITFLRHIEKTAVLVHCIDVSQVDLEGAYQTVRKELDTYSTILSEKEEIILLTKTDLVEKAVITKAVKKFNKTKRKVLTVSVYDDESILALKEELERIAHI